MTEPVKVSDAVKKAQDEAALQRKKTNEAIAASIAAEQMKKNAAAKAPNSGSTENKAVHATSAPATVQSGSVGTLMGKMKSESEAVHQRIEMALRDHDLKENNIPISHPYWGWLNEYRLLRGQGK